MDIQFFKFSRIDPLLRSKIFIFAACVVVLLIQLKIFGSKAVQVSQAKAQKDLVQRIPSMEKSIQARAIVIDEQNMAKREIHLEGTTIREGIPYALIDGVVYAQGDSVDNYSVEEIVMGKVGKVTLKNNKTQEIKILVVHNDE